MSGERVCFPHCPPGYGERPVNTGWFAGFGELAEPPRRGQVSYPRDAARFQGATFDATGLYRFNAVQRLLGELGLSVAATRATSIRSAAASCSERFSQPAASHPQGPGL